MYRNEDVIQMTTLAMVVSRSGKVTVDFQASQQNFSCSHPSKVRVKIDLAH